MAQAFSGFIADDGKAFEHEIDAIRHDACREIEKSFPETRTIVRHVTNFDKLADLMTNYVLKREMNRVSEDTTREPDTTRQPVPGVYETQTRVIPPETAARSFGCRDPWHQAAYGTGPNTCPTCELTV